MEVMPKLSSKGLIEVEGTGKCFMKRGAPEIVTRVWTILNNFFTFFLLKSVIILFLIDRVIHWRASLLFYPLCPVFLQDEFLIYFFRSCIFIEKYRKTSWIICMLGRSSLYTRFFVLFCLPLIYLGDLWWEAFEEKFHVEEWCNSMF